MARRSSTLDPILAELRAEVAHRLPHQPALPARDIDRRRMPRVPVDREASLRVGDLRLPGRVLDVGAGGVFLRTDLLVEVGERGQLETEGAAAVAVRVVWLRGAAHTLGPGLGLAFDARDPNGERAALELVLALLDSP